MLNDVDRMGLSEPPFLPVIGAVAQALYKTTGSNPFHRNRLANGQFVDEYG